MNDKVQEQIESANTTPLINKHTRMRVSLCVSSYRFPLGASAERCGFTDGSVQLLSSLCRALLPNLPSPQTANQQSRRLWPGLAPRWGGGRTRRRGAGELRPMREPLQHLTPSLPSKWECVLVRFQGYVMEVLLTLESVVVNLAECLKNSDLMAALTR